MSQRPKIKKPEDLRSQQWFGRQDRDGFAYRSWVKGKGVPHDQFDGRPVIGICNTFSELTPCNSHFRSLAEQVKIGVYEAGGFPLEFPVMSLGETMLRPTAMLYRNLASMDVEESIRGNPIDGVVLLMGCDKTTPVAGHGRGERRPADDRRVRRADAERQVARPGARLGHGRVEHERAGARRHAQAAGILRCRKLHAPQPRPLHDDGHGEHDGLDGRGARPGAAGQRRLPGGRRPAQRARAHGRPARRRHGARGPDDLDDPDARGIRERDPHARGDRRLDQCRDPPHRASPGGSASNLGIDDLDRLASELPCLRQPAAVGQAPDGRLLLCGRPAGGDEGDRGRCCTWAPSPPTARRSGTTSPTPRTSTPKSSSRSPRRSRRRPASPCCAATSRRAAPSSSRARRRRR